jgi:hypothetical protein
MHDAEIVALGDVSQAKRKNVSLPVRGLKGYGPLGFAAFALHFLERAQDRLSPIGGRMKKT